MSGLKNKLGSGQGWFSIDLEQRSRIDRFVVLFLFLLFTMSDVLRPVRCVETSGDIYVKEELLHFN